MIIDNNEGKAHNKNTSIKEGNIILDNNKKRIIKRKKSKRSTQIQINNNLAFDRFGSNEKIIPLNNISKEEKSEKNKIQKSVKKKEIIKKRNNSQLNKDEEISKRVLKKNLTNHFNKKFKKGGDNNSKFYLDTMKYNEESNKEKEELQLDFNFEHLIIRNDDQIDKREINMVSFKQALRIDKRSFCRIFISVLSNQIDTLHLFFYVNPYSHFSLNFSIYLFELLLDLTINCFLYTDDIASEKYHNNGQLSIITSLSLSIISNIASSILVFIISKLTNYEDLIESILANVLNEKNFVYNLERLLKYTKIRLGFYYFLQLLFIFFMTYYLFIFCTIYHQSQRSIMVNYIIGNCISLATSVGLTTIITILRVISIKYKFFHLYNTSRYLYEHF